MRIGFIGLGNMGGPAALNVLHGGHDLTVNDLRRELATPHLEAGARWAGSPRAVAEASELVFASLPGPKEVEAVALGPDGLVEGATAGSTFVDLSTNSPQMMRHIQSRLADRGVEVFDAPVSGGPAGATAGTLSIMVGGDEARYEAIRPVLELIGDKPSYIGPLGSGHVAKIVHNMISSCTRMAAVEGMLLAAKTGIRPEVMLQVLRDGSFGHHYLLNQSLPNQIFNGDFETPAGGQWRQLKDIGLATELGREYHVPTRIAALVEQVYIEAVGRGWSDMNSNAWVQLFEEAAGVELRAG
jgi:3-hydroxyisobutyrate dehydrogenase